MAMTWVLDDKRSLIIYPLPRPAPLYLIEALALNFFQKKTQGSFSVGHNRQRDISQQNVCGYELSKINSNSPFA